MAEVSNLKMNERLNVEWPNQRFTKMGNKNWENWLISKDEYENSWNCE